MKLASNSPVIFHFQPTDFRELQSPDELKRWEDAMKSKVGFKADFSNLSGTCCESVCGGSADDCDAD
jgi:hypothetical protein